MIQSWLKVDLKKKYCSKIIKTLADGGLYENEVMYGMSSEWAIQAKGFCNTNHTPEIDSFCGGTSRRMNLFQFNSKFYKPCQLEADEPDKLKWVGVDPKIMEEEWDSRKMDLVHLIMRTCHKYYEDGRCPCPIEFEEEKKEIEAMNNSLGEWLEMHVVACENGQIPKKKIIEAYKECENETLDNSTLRDEMKRHGFKYDRKKKEKPYVGCFMGCKLLWEFEDEEDPLDKK